MDVDLSAWQVSEKDFPESGTSADKLSFCVRYAVLAPSTYNTQPWHFVVNDDTVSLLADRRHGLAVIDPDDRELSMSCAAALYLLRLALRNFGYEETTTLLPDPKQPGLYARVKIGGEIQLTADQQAELDKDRLLFKCVTKRHSNRQQFTDKPVPDEILRSLQNAVSGDGADGCWLHICNEDERALLVRFIAEGDHIQSGDKQFRRELASWTDPRRTLSRDGLAGLGLSYEDVVGKLTPTIARRFAVDGNRAASDQELADGSPVLAILGSAKGGVLQRLHVGQAWMRILLEAQALGLSVSFLNQPCEVPALRLSLHDELAQQGRAHIILRMGFGGKPKFTSRRPIDEVLTIIGKTKSSSVSSSASSKSGFFKKLGGILKK